MTVYAIFGLGLIGGSLASSIKKAQPDSRILAYNRNASVVDDAIKEGIADYALSGPSDSALSGCDMIFLCAPTGVNINLLEELKDNISPECIITDAGSVKVGIHEKARALGLTDRFIGGHPMAGSEKTGLKNATDHMFENAYYILTPEKDVPAEMIQKYKSLVESIHALPLILSCEEHDYITAAISHLPHVIASSLVNTVHDLDGSEEHMKKIAAGGFKDITRIASSSPEMWENICVHNKDNISKVMDVFIDHLIRARDHMNADDGPYINRMFAASRDYRNSFSDSSYGVLKRVYRIYCDIIDESGAIATIATILAVGGISIKNIQILHNREFEEGVLRIEFYDEESSVKAATLLRQHRYQIWDATGKGTTSQER